MDIKINNKIDSLFPKLDKETYIALKKDIKENGIQVDLVVSKDTPNLEDGTILCGNTRYKIAKEIKLPDDEIPYKTKAFKSKEGAIEFALKDNVLRRQLNMWQKFLIVESMKEYGQKIMKLKKKVAGSESGKKGGKLSHGGGRPKKE